MSTWRPLEKPPLWKRLLPVWLHAPAVLFFQLSIAALVVFLGIVFFYILLASKYDLAEVGKLPKKTVFVDRNGAEIENSGGSGRSLVSRKDIPDFLVKALAAREDSRFFEHQGVDFRGLARATVRNLKDRNFTQGASTLTMQLARNTYDMRAKSLHRKAVEIALTMRIERKYSKDEILTNYLNRIYFGSGAYGIEQAAQTYFGKPTSELAPAEAAMVVGIIRGPHIFSPLRNFEAAKEQQEQTLARMVDAGFITQEKADKVAAEEIILRSDDSENGSGSSYAMRHVRHELDRLLDGLNVRRSGLRVTTTLDLGWQQRLERELEAAAEGFEGAYGEESATLAKHLEGEATYLQYASVTLETKTGAVMALMGGRNHGHSRYDRTSSRRDLGSIFEPMIAVAAAERGKLVLPGKPLQTGRQIGMAEVERLAKRSGISGPFLETEDLFRGGVAATPMEMATALATLGNAGKKPRPYLIKKITSEDGEVIYSAKPEAHSVFSKQAAKEALRVMKTSHSSTHYIGHTGSKRDAWILRLGPTGSTVAWFGFDTPQKIATDRTIDRELGGVIERLGK